MVKKFLNSVFLRLPYFSLVPVDWVLDLHLIAFLFFFLFPLCYIELSIFWEASHGINDSMNLFFRE